MSVEIKTQIIYTLKLDIGYANACRETKINVTEDYDVEEWKQITEEERENYLNSKVEEWAMQYVNYSWS